MNAQILNPAGMPNSTFFFPEVPPERLAVPHLRIPEMVPNPVLPYHRADAPASFLFTTVNEMCHWALTSLNRGIYQGRRILSPASYELMWTPVAKRGYPPFREEMGLGWALGHFAGVKTIAHGGGGFGWTCHLILLPEKNGAAIILCNEESSAIDRLEEAVIHALLGLEPKSGPVSWMLPIARALTLGGVQAVSESLEDITHNLDYYLDPYDLLTLVYQLLAVNKSDLALDVLKINLLQFPSHRSTRILMDEIKHRRMG